MKHVSSLKELMHFPRESVEFSYDLNGTKLFSRFRKSFSNTNALIVYFHGALERSKRAIPSYYPIDCELEGYAHQISICDPTMTSREGFPISWYAGHESFDCQKELKKFFNDIKLNLNINKIIFVGSSGGGFAALYYSFFDKDSVALTMVPQTKISNYHRPKAYEMYSKGAWSRSPIEDVSQKCCLDLIELYSLGFNNSIIYMQSSGDNEHFTRQLLPFLSSISENETFGDNFILDNTFYGKYGHSGVIKKEDYTPFLRSVIKNNPKDKEKVLTDFYKFKVNQGASLVSNEKQFIFNSENQKHISDLVNQFLLEVK